MNKRPVLSNGMTLHDKWYVGLLLGTMSTSIVGMLWLDKYEGLNPATYEATQAFSIFTWFVTAVLGGFFIWTNTMNYLQGRMLVQNSAAYQEKAGPSVYRFMFLTRMVRNRVGGVFFLAASYAFVLGVAWAFAHAGIGGLLAFLGLRSWVVGW